MSEHKFTWFDLSLTGILGVMAGILVVLGPQSAHSHTNATPNKNAVFAFGVEPIDIAKPMEGTPEATAQNFRDALKRGDKTLALQQLTDDVVIFESGYVERDKSAYARTHLTEDIKFLSTAEVLPLRQEVLTNGDFAQIYFESGIAAKSKGKAIKLYSLETLALQKIRGVWRITRVHWSSRKMEPK